LSLDYLQIFQKYKHRDSKQTPCVVAWGKFCLFVFMALQVAPKKISVSFTSRIFFVATSNI